MNPLDWYSRIDIALCVAQALRHLHYNYQLGPLVHGNLKSSNVFLFGGCKAKLSDIAFGENDGYSLPEFPEMGKLSEHSDVYAFGLLLLEIISGKRANANCSTGTEPENLVAWVSPVYMHLRKHTQLSF